MITDVISDLLTRIRNASMVNHRIVKVLNTKVSNSIVNILKNNGFITSIKFIKKNKYSYILISLKYEEKSSKSIISNLKRVSKPGLRVYVKAKNLPKVLNGFGISIISTSKGLMTNVEAERLNIGGELICHIW